VAQGVNLNNLKSRLLAEMKADKKKAILLVLLAAVGAIVLTRTAVKMLTPGHSTPARAAAETPMEPPNPGASAVSAGPSLPAPTPVSAEEAAGHEDRLSNYIAGVDRRVVRDLFQMKPGLFALADPVKVGPKVATTASATAPDLLEIRRKAILAEGARLSLQSTVTGRSPSAIINNRICPVGGAVEGFTVVDITEKTCTLEKEGVPVMLQMTRE
jgi:hypothetical protein